MTRTLLVVADEDELLYVELVQRGKIVAHLDLRGLVHDDSVNWYEPDETRRAQAWMR